MRKTPLHHVEGRARTTRRIHHHLRINTHDHTHYLHSSCGLSIPASQPLTGTFGGGGLPIWTRSGKLWARGNVEAKICSGIDPSTVQPPQGLFDCTFYMETTLLPPLSLRLCPLLRCPHGLGHVHRNKNRKKEPNNGICPYAKRTPALKMLAAAVSDEECRRVLFVLRPWQARDPLLLSRSWWVSRSSRSARTDPHATSPNALFTFLPSPSGRIRAKSSPIDRTFLGIMSSFQSRKVGAFIAWPWGDRAKGRAYLSNRWPPR